MIELELDARGVILPVRVHAGARQNAILGEREGALRVAVTAAPERGKANKAVVAVLSEVLSVSKSAIELIAGQRSPQKRFLILGGDADEIHQILADLIAS